MTDIVLTSGERAKKAHRELYHFSDDVYVDAGENLLRPVEKLSGHPVRLHIATTWKGILNLALWKPEPTIGDLFILLKNIGIGPDELLPFKDADLNDIFPWLYYGKRFDILKKICSIAKKNSERHIADKDARVHCHIVSEDTSLIVASTL